MYTSGARKPKEGGRYEFIITETDILINQVAVLIKFFYQRLSVLFLCRVRNVIFIRGFFFFFGVGILKRWQLIFYGTATNPIRLKNVQSPSQPIPFAIQQPQARSSSFPYNLNNQYLPSSNIGEIINQQGFRNIPDIFASGSEPEV